MEILSHRSAAIAPSCTILALILVACNHNGPGQKTCFVGQQVVIPSSDATDPSAGLDFFLPDGRTVSVASGSASQTVITTPPGTVTITAGARDSEGVRDVRLWVGKGSCTIDAATGVASCGGPGLISAPVASNPDPGAAGGNGCTQRIVMHNVDVTKTPTREVFFEIRADGENFGASTVRTSLVKLRAQ